MNYELSSRASKVLSLLVHAAETAIQYINDSHPELKEDETIVTRADRAVEDYLTGELEDSENGIFLIGEETFGKHSADYLEQALKGKTWIVDPIDGTAPYSHRIPVWGCSIGYAENGKLVDGGVIVPGTGELLLSDQGKTYYSQCIPMQPDALTFIRNLTVLEPPPIPAAGDKSQLFYLSQQLAHNSALYFPNTVMSFCSSVYEAILLATGRLGASALNAKLWDHAGSLCALKNLDFHMTMDAGNPESDLLTLSIGPEVYNYDFSSRKAFCQKEPGLMSRGKEFSEWLMARIKQVKE